MRQACLDHFLLVSEAHLRWVRDIYVDFYNEAWCRRLLGGLRRSDDREAA